VIKLSKPYTKLTHEFMFNPSQHIRSITVSDNEIICGLSDGNIVIKDMATGRNVNILITDLEDVSIGELGIIKDIFKKGGKN